MSGDKSRYVYAFVIHTQERVIRDRAISKIQWDQNLSEICLYWLPFRKLVILITKIVINFIHFLPAIFLKPLKVYLMHYICSLNTINFTLCPVLKGTDGKLGLP